MAKFGVVPTVIEVGITMVLSEKEARALKALSDFGDKPILDYFTLTVGTQALVTHAEGLSSLVESARNGLDMPLGKIKKAREALK